MPDLRSPYPYFGGKSRVASEVWARFGDVRNYVEPFFGSGAVLLQRPQPFGGTETINDLDGFVANFWRAMQADPEALTDACDWPVNENDLHARHAWLVERKGAMQARLEGDPDWYDVKTAGWWAWGLCCWIGSEWCSGKGPWRVVESDGVKVLTKQGNAGRGVNRQLPHLGGAGQGVNRQLREGDDDGGGLLPYFEALASRLRRVRVCCGDWSRVMGPTPTVKQGLTGVFLDPPYSGESGRDNALYTREDLSVAHQVRAWCIEHGDDPKLRIALCGYEGEHEALESAGWSCLAWKANGGYASQSSNRNGNANANAKRERIWFSPHCLRVDSASPPLFDHIDSRQPA